MYQDRLNRLIFLAKVYGQRREAERVAALDRARAQGAAIRNVEVMGVYGIGLVVGFAAGVAVRWAWGKPR